MKCKKTLAVLICAAIAASLCACGGDAGTAPGAETTAASAASLAPETTANVEETAPAEAISAESLEEESVQEEAPRAVIAYPLSGDDLTITMSFDMPGGVGTRFTDFNEHPIFQEVENRTGVHVEFVSAGGMGDAEALTLWAASGTLPDLIPNAAANYPGGGEVAVADDILMDVSAYLEYAPDYDYYRTRTPEDEQDSLTDSGYVVELTSFFSEDLGPSTGPMIRQDWLDALKLDTPVTYDDWHDVLTAFKEAYDPAYTFLLPNTISAQNNYFSSGFGVLSYTANARGRVTDPFYQVDGKVKFSLLEDEFRDYIALLNQWYEEGLISRDFVSCEADTNGPDLAGYVTSGETGIWFGDVSQMQSYDDSATDAGFHCVAITDPVQKEGDVTHFDSDRTGLTSYSVAATCENPETVMEWVNYWFTDEGVLLANYGVEGESYTMDENGKPQYTELMTANPNGDTFKTCQLLYTMIMVPTVVDTSASFGLYSDAQLEAQKIWSSNIDDAYVLPEITMTEDENNELSSIYSDLSTMISEKLIRFIIGDESMDNWSAFVTEMEDMNAQRCVEIYQTALDRYLSR